jgi:hypothetical protein
MFFNTSAISVEHADKSCLGGRFKTAYGPVELTAGSIIKIKSPLTEKVHLKKKNVVHKQHLI